MINFKEHDGLLFKMLEEHEIMPLKENDANVLVRFITHGVIGEYVMEHWLDCNQENLPIFVDSVDSDGDVTVWIDVVHHCCPFPMFEIIGTLVEEGSKEWALYQMMQGKWVYNPYLEKHKSDKIDTRCLHAYSKFGQDVVVKNILTGVESILGAANISHWTNYAEPTGWQIYEEPEPQYKVGDWVEWTDELGKTCQGQVAKIFDVELFLYKLYDIRRLCVPRWKITKVAPSDVVIHIGCLSGTVKNLSYKEDGRFWLIGKVTERCPGGMHAILYGEMLDTQTRELVESLLKAQEEEK